VFCLKYFQFFILKLKKLLKSGIIVDVRIYPHISPLCMFSGGLQWPHQITLESSGENCFVQLVFHASHTCQ
jgi:hypothetical protein